jgi:integrase
MPKYPRGVYLRGETFWIQFDYKGKTYRTSAKTTKVTEAKKLRDFYMGQVARGEFRGFVDDRLSMQDILDDLVADCTRRKLRSVDTFIHHLKPIRRFFEPMDPHLITARDIALYKKKRYGADKQPATINRELHYLGQALRFAQEKELIERIPRIRKEPEDNARQGFFDHAEFERVVSFLLEDLKDFARFAYYAGWRRNEIAHLAWSHIEGDVLRLPPTISKTKDGRVLILEGELAAIIERRRLVRRDDTPLVFHRTLQGSRYVRAGSGHPIKTFYKAWKTACAKAGTPVKRFFHDFRRTAVRNMNRAGVPRQTAKKISGHKTDEIFNRYDIVDEADIRDAVRRTQRHIAGSSTIATQSQTTG